MPSNSSASPENSPISASLQALARAEQLSELWPQVVDANRELRFSTGLRRHWEPARAEAAVLSAVQVARAQGAIVPAMRLRHLLADDVQPETVAERVALGAWRMQAQLLELMTPLNPGRMARADAGSLLGPGAGGSLSGLSRKRKAVTAPTNFAQLLSGFSRDWVATHGDQSAFEFRQDVVPGLELSGDNAQLAVDICEAKAPAWVRAGIVHAHLAVTAGNSGAGRAAGSALSRAVLISSRVEQTGVSLPDWAAALDPVRYRSALEAYETGTARGVQAWLVWYLRSLLQGAEGGQKIARSLLASVPWDGLS
ncbi:hypothetical protein [Boudabousia marimammalium]|uniref:Fido domain-containing protein n=1 Tax=Boudabousia marimammalium TaxID=156892 RepID=A0A1Q5PSU6_9ACTO|nr:hypothetical protein [Boudabousia marimammalium]OKL50636.1 hypothetical protein BM477_01405 [Boudabousia marimammalium]